ncbi:MAG: hypothetical protein D6725_02985 [Planctomycetota bacterium]|nr:MAG: hypothetical protein D6725_02985 [Planctomycetota bacterium]
MITTLGKVLTVTMTVVSVAFMGLAFIARVGGPNWNADRRWLEDEYIFEKVESPDQPTLWSVKTRLEGESVKENTRIEADAILAAYRHKIDRQKEEVAALDEQIQQVESQLAATRPLLEKDFAAIDRRLNSLRDQLAALNEENMKLLDEGKRVAEESLRLRSLAKLRREDVFRLTQQLHQLQAEQYKLDEQQSRLQDVLVRLNGVVERLEARNRQLRGQLKLSPSAGEKGGDAAAPN